MNDRIAKAKALMDVAAETYTSEIMPALPSEKRYAAAMTANALGIAQRSLSHPDPAEALLTELRAQSLDELSATLRTGETGDKEGKVLQTKLLSFLEAELAITNPRYLKRYAGGQK